MIAVLNRGECLKVMAGMPDNSVDMILADLPYGTTRCEWDSIIPLDKLWAQYKRIAKENAAIVLTSDQPFTTALIMSNIEEFRYCWTWKKGTPTGFMNAKRMPLKNLEDVCVFYRALPTYNPQGITKVRSTRVNSIRKGGQTYGKTGLKDSKPYVQEATGYPGQLLPFAVEEGDLHPTQKPIGLMRYLIETYTNPGDVVLDNVMGSGTTGIACALTGRNFIGIEQNADYCKLSERRIRAQMQPLAAFGPKHSKGDALKVIDHGDSPVRVQRGSVGAPRVVREMKKAAKR